MDLPESKKDAREERPTPTCSICLEDVIDGGERSTAKLTCRHEFHLDCIGTAFNTKGEMKCPNCRRVEDHDWLIPTGSHSSPELPENEVMNGEDLYYPAFQMPYEVDVLHYSVLENITPSLWNENPSATVLAHALSGQHAISTYPHLILLVPDLSRTVSISHQMQTHPANSSPSSENVTGPPRYGHLSHTSRPTNVETPHFPQMQTAHPTYSFPCSENVTGPPRYNHLSHTSRPTNVVTRHAFDLNELPYEGDPSHHSPSYSHSSAHPSSIDVVSVPGTSRTILNAESPSMRRSIIQPFYHDHGPSTSAGINDTGMMSVGSHVRQPGSGDQTFLRVQTSPYCRRPMVSQVHITRRNQVQALETVADHALVVSHSSSLLPRNEVYYPYSSLDHLDDDVMPAQYVRSSHRHSRSRWNP